MQLSWRLALIGALSLAWGRGRRGRSIVHRPRRSPAERHSRLRLLVGGVPTSSSSVLEWAVLLPVSGGGHSWSPGHEIGGDGVGLRVVGIGRRVPEGGVLVQEAPSRVDSVLLLVVLAQPPEVALASSLRPGGGASSVSSAVEPSPSPSPAASIHAASIFVATFVVTHPVTLASCRERQRTEHSELKHTLHTPSSASGEGRLTSGHVHLFGELQHVVESGRDHLLGLLQNVDELSGLLGIAGGEEAVGRAGLLGTGRSADAVDVVLGVVGEVKVDHKLYVVDICGSRGGGKG